MLTKKGPSESSLWNLDPCKVHEVQGNNGEPIIYWQWHKEKYIIQVCIQIRFYLKSSYHF